MRRNVDINKLSEEIVDVLFFEHAFEDNPFTEDKLAAYLKTTRSFVREALKSLEKVGIVERRQKRGIHLKKLTPELISSVFDLRAVLEGFAGRLVAQRSDEKDIQELEKLANDFTNYRQNGYYEKCENIHRKFHSRIIELSGNHLLVDMMNTFAIVEKAFRLAYSVFHEHEDLTTPYPHEAIVERLKAGDGTGCEDLLRSHVQSGKRRVLEKCLGFQIEYFHR